MATTRYFRKMGDTPVPLSNGQRAAFTSVDGGLTSYKATSDPWLASEFEAAMREGRSGLTEIDYATFDRDYLQKKNSGQTLKPLYREELGRNLVMPSQSDLSRRLQEAQAVVAVASPEPRAIPTPMQPIVTAQAEVNKAIAQALPTAAEYKPEVGKRRKAKAA